MACTERGKRRCLGQWPTTYLVHHHPDGTGSEAKFAQAQARASRYARTGVVNGDKGANLTPEYGGGDEHGAMRMTKGCGFGV
jgi:hypothetical protein